MNGLRQSSDGWLTLSRDGNRLAVRDFGGNGPPALLLHGLADHAEEWGETAEWLTRHRRVLALDCRAHGRSERDPEDVSLDALVGDVAFVIGEVADDRVLLLGQSLGGLTAIVAAAHHPGLVNELIVAEAGPTGAGYAGAREKAAEVEASLARWPVPFSSPAAAESFFGGPSPHASAWVAGIEERADGWYPAFEIETVGKMLRESLARDHWEDWSLIQGPTLVVRGAQGSLSLPEAERMVGLGQRARMTTLLEAGHELHLEASDAWQSAIEGFLDSDAITHSPR